MEFGIGCCCKTCGVHTVGFWGLYNQSVWAVDFPTTWTKLTSRTAANISSCNVLVIGHYNYNTASGASSQPSTARDQSAVASWVSGGGVLFVVHEYYGFPSLATNAAVNDLNTSLDGIGTQVRAGTTVSPAPNVTDTPIGTFAVSSAEPVLAGVDKLSIAAPGHTNLRTATLILEVRKSPAKGYATILTIESMGSGFVVFLSDFSVLNNFNAASRAATGNKIERFLCNLGEISTN